MCQRGKNDCGEKPLRYLKQVSQATYHRGKPKNQLALFYHIHYLLKKNGLLAYLAL